MNTSNTAKKQTAPATGTTVETTKAILKNIKIVKPQASSTEKSRGPRDCFPLG